MTDLDIGPFRDAQFVIRSARGAGGTGSIHLPASEATRDNLETRCNSDQRDSVTLNARDPDVFPDYHLEQHACSKCLGVDNKPSAEEIGRGPEDVLREAGFLDDEDQLVTDGGFHSGDHHVLYDDRVDPGPDLEDFCTEDGCTETAHDRCGCCGMKLCGQHNEVQGGFCSNFERVAGVPGCLVWETEFAVYQRAFYDDDAEVLEFNGTYCLEEDGVPICGSGVKRLERVELQELDREHDLCAECEDVAVDRLTDENGGGDE